LFSVYNFTENYKQPAVFAIPEKVRISLMLFTAGNMWLATWQPISTGEWE